MSEHIQRTIDDLRAKRTAIDDLIGRLEDFQRAWPITAAAVTPAIVDHMTKASRTNTPSKRAKPAASRHPAPSVPTATPRERPRTLADAVSAPGATTAAVMARDAAILARLKKGPAKFDVLLAAMPQEAALDGDQRQRACSNALTRLRVKKQIKASDDGWALA